MKSVMTCLVHQALAIRTISLVLLSCAVAFGGAAEDAALLKDLLKSRDPAKALALAQRGEPTAAFLIEGLEKPGRIPALCAWALWQHPVPGTDAALRARLLKIDQVTGYFAARALGKLPSPENANALATLLPNEKLGFWELDIDGAPRLTDMWDRKGRVHAVAPEGMPNLRVAYAAMEALGEIGGPVASATLLRALENDQYLIRYGAVRGLARMKATVAIEKLEQLSTSDPVLLVRLAAEKAVAELNGEPRKVAAKPPLPPAIAFVKTVNRSDANLGFRDSYFFPRTPRYHSGENLYTLTPPKPTGTLKNLTQLQNGEVQAPEVSFDGTKILFSMRRDKERDGFHIFEINIDGSGLRQLTRGNCNDVDPHYLPDGRIVFGSDRAGYQEYYHQERSRVLYVMNGDGSDIRQITFNPNQDYEPRVLRDGRVLYSSYRFYAQDGSFGPLRGERMGLARIETVLRTVNPDGSADQLFYGSMRGTFYAPLRALPFSDQFAGWHPRGNHVGVTVSQGREMPDGKIICMTPAGLTLVDPKLAPLDCEQPIFPEVVNLAGGEEVYIHNYDDKNPIGRYTAPYPAGDGWVFVSHAPWHDLRDNGYAIRLMNLATRELELVYDDPQMSDVDAVPLMPRSQPGVRKSTLAANRPDTGLVLCNSVFNSDLPFDHQQVKYVRVLEGIQMGQSISANAAFRTRILGTAPIHSDGSFFVEVPADVPIRFELLDADGEMLVHETEFNYVRPGETRGCVGCHENPRETTSNHRPLALSNPPFKATRNRGDLIYFGQKTRPYNTIYRE